MTERLMKWVYMSRSAAYIILVVLIIIAGIKEFSHADECEVDNVQDIEIFWPADWIPHPHPPSPPEKDRLS